MHCSDCIQQSWWAIPLLRCGYCSVWFSLSKWKCNALINSTLSVSLISISLNTPIRQLDQLRQDETEQVAVRNALECHPVWRYIYIVKRHIKLNTHTHQPFSLSPYHLEHINIILPVLLVVYWSQQALSLAMCGLGHALLPVPDCQIVACTLDSIMVIRLLAADRSLGVWKVSDCSVSRLHGIDGYLLSLEEFSKTPWH